MIKGHLNSSHKTIMEMSPHYFKRLWHNEESYIYEEGFEKEYEKRIFNIPGLCREKK